MSEDRRTFRRVTFEAHSQLDSGGDSYSCELLDISLRGALLRCENEIPISETAQLRIYLPSTEITLTFDVELVHSKDSYYGYRFLGSDIESISHLRRLLELNSKDNEGIEGEIAAWLEG